MSAQLSDREAMEIRVRRATEFEYAVEMGVLTPTGSVTRDEVRTAIQRLTAAERRVLHSRLRRRVRRVNEIMDGERKAFDEPRVTPTDLPKDLSLTRDDANQV